MYSEGKRLDILLLLETGVPQEQIAKLTDASIRTIRRMVREPAQPRLAIASPAVTEPAGRPQRSGPSRPPTIEPYRETVTATLEQMPKLKSLEVLRRLREQGYIGGKSAVYGLVNQLCQQMLRPI